jgi:hypothetical protein
LGGELRVGQTVSITVDNPTERNFFRGWSVKLLSGGANSCYAGDNCTTPAYDPGSVTTKLAIGTFEYFTYGRWYDGNGDSPLLDTDTNDGLTISITRTGRQTAQVTMSSPGNPVHSDNVTFSGSGLADWIMVEYFGTDSDTYPALMSVSAIPEPATASLLVLGAGTLMGAVGSRHRR